MKVQKLVMTDIKAKTSSYKWEDVKMKKESSELADVAQEAYNDETYIFTYKCEVYKLVK